MQVRNPRGLAFIPLDEEIQREREAFPCWVPREKVERREFPYEGSLEEQLTDEILDFCEFFKPTESEKRMRNVWNNFL